MSDALILLQWAHVSRTERLFGVKYVHSSPHRMLWIAPSVFTESWLCGVRMFEAKVSLQRESCVTLFSRMGQKYLGTLWVGERLIMSMNFVLVRWLLQILYTLPLKPVCVKPGWDLHFAAPVKSQGSFQFFFPFIYLFIFLNNYWSVSPPHTPRQRALTEIKGIWTLSELAWKLIQQLSLCQVCKDGQTDRETSSQVCQQNRRG